MSDGALNAHIRRLVDIPSVSGSEGEVGRFLEGDLRDRGFSVELQEVASDRHNVYATRKNVLPRVVLCTHIDTVPPFYGSTEDPEYIYGRGTCDAKGIVAAMTFAVAALVEDGIEDVGLLFVVGEEVDSAGAMAANSLASQASFVVVGEPTGNRMANGHKGGFKCCLKARGKAAHSAYPHLGDSAIERLLDALGDIRRADWGTSDVLGPSTVNVGTISGGLAANVLAPSAEAEVFVRVVDSVEAVQQKLETILAAHPAVDYELIAKSDAIICETLPGFEIAPMAFGTDIPSLETFGKPLLIGPGTIHDAHTAREKIGKAEAAEAVGYYQDIAKQLLAKCP
jgi:acetylornithine deacetylase